MAEFCRQCATEMGLGEAWVLPGRPNGTPRGTLRPGYGWAHLCEGCGPITTDDDGRCQGLCMNVAHGGVPIRPTLIHMPYPTYMHRGARFVWNHAHYLVVNHHPHDAHQLWIVAWNWRSRFLLWLGWGLWKDTSGHPCGNCSCDVRRHHMNGRCRDCDCPGYDPTG